jgi:HK97 family phage prohead protease
VPDFGPLNNQDMTGGSMTPHDSPPPDGEVKFIPFEFRKSALEGRFEGYASLFDHKDLGNDVIRAGAFAASLKKRGAAGIKMLFQHDPKEPIGVWTHIAEDTRGLFVRGRLLDGVIRAREVLALMQAGALDGLSIGFHTVKGRTDPRSGVRTLETIDLWEISIVTFPMQPEARISALKGGLPTERQFERWLTRDAGFSRRQARTVIGKGYRTLTGGRDAAGKDSVQEAALAAKLHAAAATMHQQKRT